jgi:hypothetical protein
MKRAAIYLRVSTTDQHTSNQENELRQAAERAGWQVVKVYKDHGISGAKGRDKRPAFDALHRDAAKRQFDVVMAWNVDRLGRRPAGPGGPPRHRPARPCSRCSARLPNSNPAGSGGSWSHRRRAQDRAAHGRQSLDRAGDQHGAGLNALLPETPWREAQGQAAIR